MADLRLAVDVAVRGHRLTLRSDAGAIGVSGPSGAGKSTLLRVLAGIEPKAIGSVSAFGEDWSHRPAWRRGVGWVPQDALLFPHLTVRENLGHAGKPVDGGLVAWLGLEPLLDRRPARLSGGEAQRVALGRAMCAGPRLLLLDEPFAALDRRSRRDVATRVAAWSTERGVAVVMVSHDPTDFQPFGAEAWQLEGGQLTRDA